MIKLPNAETLQEKDVLDAVRKLIRSQVEQSETLQNLFHSGQERIANEISSLRQEMKDGFEEQTEATNQLRRDTNEGFAKLKDEIQEQTGILKMIAENTKS